MKKVFILITAYLSLTGFVSNFISRSATSPEITKETSVSSLLIKYGEPAPLHYIENADPGKAKIGEEVVKKGRATLPNGEKTQLISSYFVCTDCHNVAREANELSDNDPYHKLDYAKSNDIPYMTASTFFGIYNRESWFTGYEKKYGELALKANNNLREAIQLCSKECSSGRHMNDQELESVLHYFASLQLKLGDLALSGEELERLNQFKDDPNYKKEMISLLKSKYINAYAATFAAIIPVGSRKLGKDGNAGYGEIIFEKSCMHCHEEGRVAQTVFSPQGKKNAAWLVSYFLKNNGGSIYNITRTGTESSKKTPQYMPIYSEEKLTDAMLDDLAAYLLKQSAAGDDGK